MKSYSELLKSYIEKSGKTLDQIAKECEDKGIKVHPTYISKLRLGNRQTPSDEITKVLAEVVGGDVGRLLWLGWIDDNPLGVKQALADVNDLVIEKAMALRGKYPDAFKDDADLSGVPEYEEFHEALSESIRENITEYSNHTVSNEKMREKLKDKLNINNNEEKINFIKVPILGKIPAGEPITAESNIIEWITIPNPGNTKGDEFFMLVVQGDSMIGSRIQDGDKVLVRRQSYVESGEIAVVNVNRDDATLKRVKRTASGQVILYPDNPKYEPIFIENENARIIGKVIQVIFEPSRL